MGLEEDIRQSRFRNEYQKAMINMTFTQYRLAEKTKEFFDKFDLTPQQFNILRILRGAGKPISTLQIRERMLDRMSDTSRIVDRLVGKGLVTKKSCEADKRLVDVSISRKGQLLLKKLDESNDAMDGLMNGLTTEEATQLNSLLDKVRSALS